MNPNPKLDGALKVLQARGHEVGEAAVSPEGGVLIAVDGRPLTFPEIYVLADHAQVRKRHSPA